MKVDGLCDGFFSARGKSRYRLHVVFMYRRSQQGLVSQKEGGYLVDDVDLVVDLSERENKMKARVQDPNPELMGFRIGQ